MDNLALERAERIAQNLPVEDLQMCRKGEVYFAYGHGPNDGGDEVWHGIWFTDFNGGMGQVIEFAAESSEKAVQTSLYTHGLASMP